jgi:hypothetical protein
MLWHILKNTVQIIIRIIIQKENVYITHIVIFGYTILKYIKNLN